MSSESIFKRLGLLAELSKRAQLGRTQFMKLLFFLQESQNVPLGYQFSLYSYGPFDSEVLGDIATAERLNILKSTTVSYSSGIGYVYSTGSEIDSAKELANDFLNTYKKEVDWVLEKFSRKTAGELELLSTLLFVGKYHNPSSIEELTGEVHSIKPHFSLARIKDGFDELVSLEIFKVVA